GGVQIVTALAGDAGAVWADASQLEQVILNLVVNARDAMPRGGTIRISTTPVTVEGLDLASNSPPGPERFVRLEVRHAGAGRDEPARTPVSEPYFTTKAAGKGTGLGLATVYGIVKQSRGFISADSAPGRGTTFSIYLPQTSARIELAPAVPAPRSVRD